MPAHTLGHNNLVQLPQAGAVLLTGDLVHFCENYGSLDAQPINSVAARRWPHPIAPGKSSAT